MPVNGNGRSAWRPRAGGRCSPAGGLALLAALALGACAAEKRISVAELEDLERAATHVPPIPVEHQSLALAELRPYTVGPGDVLSIRMYGLAEERYTPTTLELRVQDDGDILMPVVGPSNSPA